MCVICQLNRLWLKGTFQFNSVRHAKINTVLVTDASRPQNKICSLRRRGMSLPRWTPAICKKTFSSVNAVWLSCTVACVSRYRVKLEDTVHTVFVLSVQVQSEMGGHSTYGVCFVDTSIGTFYVRRCFVFCQSRFRCITGQLSNVSKSIECDIIPFSALI